LGCAVLAVFAVVSTASAGKPGGGNIPPADTGTIYFWTGGDKFWPAGVYAMATNGRDKTTGVTNILLGSTDRTVEPSKLLHNGLRWFLIMGAIDGETYPDGYQRVEIFAVSAAGVWVQLTDDANVQLFVEDLQPRWSRGDTGISFVGRRWGVVDGAAAVVEYGIYALSVNADLLGPGYPALPPAVLPIVFDNQDVGHGMFPDVHGYDYSADNSQMVFAQQSGLFVANVGTGAATLIASDPPMYLEPRWGGAKILVRRGGGSGSHIDTMYPDGTGRVTVILAGTGHHLMYAYWSPSFTHFVYELMTYRGNIFDIYRAAQDGSGVVNLTADFSPAVGLLGWEE
jgi:hypothetical protein